MRVSFARNSAGGLQLKDNNDYYPFGMNHLKTGNSYFGPKMTLNVPATFGTVGESVLPQTAFRTTDDLAPLSASQFSKFFKGTAIARATPATRGFLNKYLNKGLNGVNSIGLYRTLYPLTAKMALPHNDHNNR